MMTWNALDSPGVRPADAAVVGTMTKLEPLLMTKIKIALVWLMVLTWNARDSPVLWRAAAAVVGTMSQLEPLLMSLIRIALAWPFVRLRWSTRLTLPTSDRVRLTVALNARSS